MNTNIIKNFFVFEGVDGSGTTTQIPLLADYFRTKNKSVFETSEPTTFETGRFLRNCLSGTIQVQPETILLLFAADRNEHIFSPFGILSSLKKYDYVISDRYLFSSLAYQGASGLFEQAKKYNENFPLPEVLFFFDCDAETAFHRVEKRSASGTATKEIYETKLFQKKVRYMYEKVLALYANTAMKTVVVDANRPIECVHAQIIYELQKLKIIQS